MSDLIRMRRETPQHEGGPVTAEVHPDEVENFERENWLVEEAPSAPQVPAEPKAKRKAAKQDEAPQVPAEQ